MATQLPQNQLLENSIPLFPPTNLKLHVGSVLNFCVYVDPLLNSLSCFSRLYF